MIEKSPKDLDALTLELTWRTEENLLGSLLIAGSDGSRDSIDAVSKIVSVDDFLPNHRDEYARRIYAAMLESWRTDQISTANTMHRLGTLKAGDIALMCRLVAEAVSSLDCESYAQQVKALADERRGKFRPRYRNGV